jgi:hypothetical protein
VKEKLKFMQVQNGELNQRLVELELEVGQRRDSLSSLKQRRDVVRAENVELKQKSGLLGNDDLLRDFEKRQVFAQLSRAFSLHCLSFQDRNPRSHRTNNHNKNSFKLQNELFAAKDNLKQLQDTFAKLEHKLQQLKSLSGSVN